MRIERGVCLVRQYLPLEALANVDPVLEQNPRHPLALHVKVYNIGDIVESGDIYIIADIEPSNPFFGWDGKRAILRSKCRIL